MSKLSEEVLLIVNHVRQKKTDGTLYLMGERLAWMVQSKNTFSISHMYADIKAQKISPDSKDKVQLQIVMHDGSANTFHFNCSGGRSAQIRDRDSVKELLQQLLPKFKKKISSALEEKNRLLQENPELFQLYKDLVVSGVISPDEFWLSHTHRFTSGNKSTEGQVVGVSPAFLADIKPQTDGCNGLKYNLTADIIESIFKTYPMVRKKHAEYVPHEMTESEFWTRFFQSHYFHRDRTILGTKDIFTDCAKNDEKEMKDEIEKRISDPLLDLTRCADNSVDEGYRGINEDSRRSSNTTNQSIIRRFNHHSTMVLRACEAKSKPAADSSKSEESNGVTVLSNGQHSLPNGVVASTSKNDIKEPPQKKARIKEKLELEDLCTLKNEKVVNLRLGRIERYLHGPTPATISKYTTSEKVIEANQLVAEEIHKWVPDLSQVLLCGNAIGVLGELSPGGALMQGTTNQQLHQMVPQAVQDEVRQQYNALCELLRHFWSCFPVASKFLEEKVVKMRSTLEKFQLAKLNPLKDKLGQNHYHINLTGHMEDMLIAAYNKFDAWKAKKMTKR
ncbi:general transcription factor IIH subunit 1-like [Gigantopelta aegis]|uniref:general transcription factor IIH subunit 1-like n=1 Tax=Gigantopelta aegis TaxID=1735272 RepID=UPI001B8873CC|nr:general transcription factor IIH subunit 1-like [Gigantopelta aegis]